MCYKQVKILTQLDSLCLLSYFVIAFFITEQAFYLIVEYSPRNFTLEKSDNNRNSIDEKKLTYCFKIY